MSEPSGEGELDATAVPFTPAWGRSTAVTRNETTSVDAQSRDTSVSRESTTYVPGGSRTGEA